MTPPFRIGYGYDIHPLVKNRKLILGGVLIPFEKGLEGHSDADCLSHAIADAILGGVGKPDIGHYFPDRDPALKNIDSQRILRKAVEEAEVSGYRIINLDATVIAENPKIGPHAGKMKGTLAATLGVSPSQIGIKATTHEGIGDLGRGAGIAAMAAVLLQAL